MIGKQKVETELVLILDWVGDVANDIQTKIKRLWMKVNEGFVVVDGLARYH